jgi:outer membrane lipoprotein-sorting protein
MAVLAIWLAPAAAPAQADEGALPDGAEVARRINARDEGLSSSRRIRMELIDKRGSVREREALMYRRFFGEDKRMALFYLSPATIRDTAFLTHDYANVEAEDDYWLYLPALRKVRRIATRDRGKSFLGTDLSFEDVKKETKVSLEEYTWETLREEELEGRRCLVLESIPIDEKTRRELGYGRVVSWVDTENWLIRKAEIYDRADRHLKTSRIREIRQIDGIWTPHLIEVENHKSGHRTVFRIDQVNNAVEIPEDVFTERSLRQGPP